MVDELFEHAARLAAFDWLDGLIARHGEVLSYAHIKDGFGFRGDRILLWARPKGIFKPRQLAFPLSLYTTLDGPYDDRFDGGMLSYRYRGEDPQHHDNAGLREAYRRSLPLVHLHVIVKGRYMPTYPVFVVGDDPGRLTFQVQVDERSRLATGAGTMRPLADDDASARRKYVTTTVLRRVHQQSFRMRVLKAYRTHCALCRLQVESLLDAAHIIPDGRDGGEPVVPNGLALCKIHHAAFDRNILGIRPDYVVEVQHELLEKIDGPMLKHGLQEMHGTKLWLPRSAKARPDPDRLEKRYEEFRRSA